MSKRGKAAAPTANRFAVHEVALAARPLVTIGPDHHVWGGKGGGLLAELPGLAGAIVRVQPPHDATDGFIAEVGNFLKLTAHSYRIDARQPGPELARAKDAPPKRSTPREVAMAMAAASSRREELEALLDAELSKVAL